MGLFDFVLGGGVLADPATGSLTPSSSSAATPAAPISSEPNQSIEPTWTSEQLPGVAQPYPIAPPPAPFYAQYPATLPVAKAKTGKIKHARKKDEFAFLNEKRPKYNLEFWDDWEAPWDTLYLNADRMPGIWEIQSGECARQMDHKKTKDKDKAVVKDLGSLPVKLTATGRLISREDWVELQRVLPLLNPRFNGGLKTPVSIYHPVSALLGISTVYITRLAAPTLSNGILSMNIDMIEWSQPKKAKVGKAPGVPPPEPAPLAPVDITRDLEIPTYQKRLGGEVVKIGPGGAVVNMWTGEETKSPSEAMVDKPVAAPPPAPAFGVFDAAGNQLAQ